MDMSEVLAEEEDQSRTPSGQTRHNNAYGMKSQNRLFYMNKICIFCPLVRGCNLGSAVWTNTSSGETSKKAHPLDRFMGEPLLCINEDALLATAGGAFSLELLL